MSIPPRKKIVFDTNVLIRTTFRKRSPVSLRIYQAIEAQECILVTSPAILEEIRDVISRDYIIEYTHTTPDMRTRYMNELIDMSMLTSGTKELKKKSRDIKDNKF
jgi:putative PIN family toxin of toxin-antitoxin system